jgi:hypothetical protein
MICYESCDCIVRDTFSSYPAAMILLDSMVDRGGFSSDGFLNVRVDLGQLKWVVRVSTET